MSQLASPSQESQTALKPVGRFTADLLKVGVDSLHEIFQDLFPASNGVAARMTPSRASIRSMGKRSRGKQPRIPTRSTKNLSLGRVAAVELSGPTTRLHNATMHGLTRLPLRLVPS
jgi:hypothetical protein